MKVKICGLRRVADAEQALELGATHLGVVLAPDSPRCASLAEARAIAALVPAHTDVVLVCRQLSDAAIAHACRVTGVRCVQVHDGDARRDRRLRRLGLRPIPVLRVAKAATALPAIAPRPTAQRPVLLDGGCGGQGVAFDWSLLGEAGPEGVFVAGGITPANVEQLLRHRPWGIDVSSGVECAPGLKDRSRLRELFQALRMAGEVVA